MPISLAVVLTVFLLFLNAFFVLAEFAIVKVRATRVEELIREGQLKASVLKKILDNLDSALSAIQLGITMASLGIGWMGEPAIARFIEKHMTMLPITLSRVASHSIAFGLAFAAITFLHVVVGELAPKSIAIRYPTASALWSAVPLKIFIKIFYLPMRVLNGASNLLLRAFGLGIATNSETGHSEEELRILLSQSQEHGKMSLTRLLLFENLFDFSRATVRDVMTPVSLIASLRLGAPWSENEDIIRSRKYSRYPLIGRDLSDVLGVVHIKDILMSTVPPDLAKLRRDVLVIGETSPLERTLNPLRSRHANLAVVKNKAGQVTGLLTLEDVLEELVGEIEDEYSPPRVLLFANMIAPEAVDLRLEGETKEQLFQILLRRMIQGRPDLKFEPIWRALWERESSLTSAVGRGVAIPHARISKIDTPMLAFARLTTGRDFGAPDKKPVRLLFMILTPQHLPGIQVRLLARIAGLASNRSVYRSLMAAKAPKDVIDILVAYDQTNPE